MIISNEEANIARDTAVASFSSWAKAVSDYVNCAGGGDEDDNEWAIVAHYYEPIWFTFRNQQ